MWQAGLKTGMYYLRTRAAADAIKFTVDQQALAKKRAERAARTGTGNAAVAPATALKVVGWHLPPLPYFKVRTSPLECLT